MTNAMTRRGFLDLAALAVAGALLPRSLRADEPAKRRIFASGGQYLLGPGTDRLLLKYMISLVGKKDPTICFLPTAQADAAQAIVNWYESMNELPCRPKHMRLINNSTNLKEFEAQLLAMDAIFVGGGNTLNMLAIWKAQGVDKVLRKAWENGVLLTGESAGMICWYEQGVSDSRPGELSVIEGLGWLKGGACPHYHHKNRQPSCHKLLLSGELKDGVCCDEGVALLYEGEKLTRAVAAIPRTAAYLIRKVDGKVVEEGVSVELLKR